MKKRTGGPFQKRQQGSKKMLFRGRDFFAEQETF